MRLLRAVLTAALTVAIFAYLPVCVDALGRKDVTFSTQTQAGTNGTSYVFFQAHESSGRTTSVPSRRFVGCPVPYYVRWMNVVYRPNSTSYDAVIYSCATGKPIDNLPRSGELLWGPGERMLIAGIQDLNASGQLVYALNVNLTPAQVQPGQTSRLSATIADDFVAQADRTLNISVDPVGWKVDSWSVDFGDGQTTTQPGGAPNIGIDHQYAAPAAVQPRVTAHVSGNAQVADFDPATGDVVLLTQPFTVDVTNSTSGRVNQQPVVAYTSPAVRAAVVAQLAPGAPPPQRRGVATVEAPRGTTVFLYVRPIVDREGAMTLDGKPAGDGQTAILRWTLRGGSTDGPPAGISPAGASGAQGDPIAQQWNTPDRIGPSGPEPYFITMDYTVRTTYPDGQVRDYDFSGSVPVTVAYSANSG
jgi:hypothetical protein